MANVESEIFSKITRGWFANNCSVVVFFFGFDAVALSFGLSTVFSFFLRAILQVIGTSFFAMNLNKINIFRSKKFCRLYSSVVQSQIKMAIHLGIVLECVK